MRKLGVAFLDLFLIMLLYVTLMWILSMILISIKSKEVPTPKPKAEFILTTTWPTGVDSDVDIWMERDMDAATTVWYDSREVDCFILHNDNTGSNYGKVEGKELKEARETLTIEQIVPGLYELSLLGYSIRNTSKEVTVLVELEKTSPYSLLFSREVTVRDGEETRICRFNLNAEGEPYNWIFDEDILRFIANGINSDDFWEDE